MTASDTATGAAPAGALPAALPLEGVRVLEFGHVAAAPFAGMLLADLGADVVKVEPPTGDQMRQWPPLATGADGEAFSYNFGSLNRNKRSIVADLKADGDKEMVSRLVGRADVIIENYRPGAMDRLGYGFDSVTRGHRGLVYCSISGFGKASPYRDSGAFDVIVQGMSGLMSVTGEPGGPPIKSGVPVGDFVTGLYAAYSIAAALPGVRESGTPVYLDCPMLDCLIAVSALQTSEFFGTGKTPQPLGTGHSRNAPYQAFRASDAYFTMAAGNNKLWGSVCEVVGMPELFEDERFVTQSLRAAHQFELEGVLQEVFARRSAKHWIEVFTAAGVPCGPVNTFEQMLGDEHAEASGLVSTMGMPVAGTSPMVVFPARTAGTSMRLDYAPPVLGAHTEEIAAEWLV